MCLRGLPLVPTRQAHRSSAPMAGRRLVCGVTRVGSVAYHARRGRAGQLARQRAGEAPAEPRSVVGAAHQTVRPPPVGRFSDGAVCAALEDLSRSRPGRGGPSSGARGRCAAAATPATAGPDRASASARRLRAPAASVRVSRIRLATRKSGRPCWRVPRKSPGPRSSRSTSAILKPSVVRTMALAAACRCRIRASGT